MRSQKYTWSYCIKFAWSQIKDYSHSYVKSMVTIWPFLHIRNLWIKKINGIVTGQASMI